MVKLPSFFAYVATLLCETSSSAKQTTNDKIKGSVTTYLRCDGVVNNQIKKGLLLSLRVKKNEVSEYLAKLQARAWLSHALCAPANTLLNNEESARDNHALACNFAKYLPIKKIHWQTQQ